MVKLPGTYDGRFSIDLPGRQYMATRLRAITEEPASGNLDPQA
ncbi:DUF5605 domain-containing protein [Paenarthrobacter sp. MMS21-TAE1-1]|uniref:DUF5605 domain-containing protein n=1 Tax=Paenarthrobacter aromaticivorans TaxID=2849150 RepID=A0ABS6IBE2_9MICC|nr:DUF5605 domain-containing protein [Paenarthrobacter sp. MMS21-TAE1-1]